MTMKTRESITGYLFFLPALIGLVFLLAIPIIFSLYISFTDYNMYNEFNWVGLRNYRNLFNDRLFFRSLWNTIYYVALSVPINTAVGIFLALLLNNDKIKGLKFFRTTFYLPTVVSGVAVALLWQWVLDPNFGLINNALNYIGIQGPGWLTSTVWSKPSIILMNAWAVGGTMIIYLAGLQGIPESLYESATIDGAGPIRKFINITLPMLSPTIFFNVIMGVISGFQVFMQAYIMTDGGPNNSTLFYAFYLYNKAFRDLQMGSASAMGWILLVITLALTLVIFKFSSSFVYYEDSSKN